MAVGVFCLLFSSFDPFARSPFKWKLLNQDGTWSFAAIRRHALNYLVYVLIRTEFNILEYVLAGTYGGTQLNRMNPISCSGSFRIIPREWR